MRRTSMPLLGAFLTFCAAAVAQDPDPTLRSGGSVWFAGPQAPSGYAVETLYTNLPGHPTAQVPGMSGAQFGPGTSTNHFDRIYGSPLGNFIFTADTDLPGGADEVVVANGFVVAVEGDPAPWTGGAEVMRTFDTRVGINDAGTSVFTQSTDGPSSSNDYVVSVSGGIYTAVAQEGGALPMLPGATWDDAMTSAVIMGNGAVGFEADGVDGPGITTADDELLVLGGTLLVREGVDVPTGQATGSAPWENFDLGDLWVTPDGGHWLVQGDLDTGGTSDDDVVAFDGAVVLQEGFEVPGSGFTQAIADDGIFGVHLDAGGNWLARGENVGGADWVVRNGQVIATEGDPITSGATEVWSDTGFSDGFFLHVGNGAGNYVVGGVTDAAPSTNAVLVADGRAVVAREGDPVDLDGNGMFDDGLFFESFGNDDAFLSDLGELYFVATLMDAAGAGVGQGVFRIELGGVGQQYCVANANSSGAPASIWATGSPSVAANDLVLNAGPLPAEEPGLFYYGAMAIQVPFGNGFRCVGGPMFKLWPSVTSTAAGMMSRAVDMTSPPGGAMGGLITPGATWYFQVWFRDRGVGMGFDFSNGLEVMFGA